MARLYDGINEKQLQEDAESSLLHYGTAFHPEVITHAKGQWIETASGHRMLDWTSGQMVYVFLHYDFIATNGIQSCLVGHGDPEIAKVVRDHAEQLDHLFSGMLSPPVIRAAKRLTSLTPPGLDKAFFLSTGGESNEAAIRLAKF
jgi:4-aminobutyrate aminotransferase-like enzyme